MKKIILLCFTLISLTAHAQVKVGSNPTNISTTSNLEVEAANGGKVIITKDSSKVIIKDGTQGEGRILISDVNGKASWKSLESANVSRIVFAGFGSISVWTNTPSSNDGSNVLSRIVLNPLPAYASSFSLSERAFIIPETGYYRVEAGVRCWANGTAGAYTMVFPGFTGLSSQYSLGHGQASGATSMISVSPYNAGDRVFMSLFSGPNGLRCAGGFMLVSLISL